ncbi:MAG: hypothetical protein B5766_01175 [Candidatus Lumbricidophila eiseniae]|uniref:Peptidase S54 rhomboid domain-containing protein n=1 Tax=Candidatus Lumbricidiphila eiseniae TaxID=1969409 RepID=A0A2A6FUL5_9MICO|nr:MAG: hypothetical protein B5766_01175 [Candidatus Lumbricidophila eiseniae]
MADLAHDRVNFCYRHAQRQSFVLCQRCGQTVCGECQTPAPVGVICPSCIQGQRKTGITRPSLVTRWRRRAEASDAPVVTYAIIAITVVMYLLQLVPVLRVTELLYYEPAYSTPAYSEPWRMLTVLFVHSSLIFHVLLNMYTLLVLGRMLEPMLGRWRFLALYFIAGLGGSVGVLWFSELGNGAVVGASGALFGVMGALLVIQRRLGGPTVQLLVLVGINLALGFFVPTISWQAHVGGLLTGLLLGLILVETRANHRQRLQPWLMTGLTLVLIVLSLRYFVFPVGPLGLG